MIDGGIVTAFAFAVIMLGFRVPVEIAIGHTEPSVILECL
jgi:hypothetical protein